MSKRKFIQLAGILLFNFACFDLNAKSLSNPLSFSQKGYFQPLHCKIKANVGSLNEEYNCSFAIIEDFGDAYLIAAGIEEKDKTEGLQVVHFITSKSPRSKSPIILKGSSLYVYPNRDVSILNNQGGNRLDVDDFIDLSMSNAIENGCVKYSSLLHCSFSNGKQSASLSFSLKSPK